jgi:hypothetical protein
MAWLLHTVTGGGLLLLLAWWMVRRQRNPVRRQRLGEWSVVAALALALLSLAPAWIYLPLPSSHAPAPPASASALPAAPLPAFPDWNGGGGFVADLGEIEGVPAATVDCGPLPETTTRDWLREHFVRVVLAAYGLAAALLLGRWLLGHWALWRLLRAARPAPDEVAWLAEKLAPEQQARIVVSDRAPVPFSCGLLRPAVVLPAALAEAGPTPQLRWVLAHELAHLERRDAWSGLLFGLAQTVYFYLPWFWWLRRHVRLCQEYLADAAASESGGPVHYAQFLVGWARAPAPPVGCTGVSGSCSDLFRRVSMLLHNSAPLERRCPRIWSLLTAGGLLVLAVLFAGLGAYAGTAPRKEEPPISGPKKDQPRKEEPKEDQPDVDPFSRQLQEMLKGLRYNLDPQTMDRIRKEMEKHRGELEKALRGMELQGLPSNFLRTPQALIGTGAEPRLGARVAKASAALADQLDLPQGQGLVVEHVKPDSPAAKAGLKAHDVLLELDGKPVPSNVTGLMAQLAVIKARNPVDAVVLRKGKKETVRGIKLAEDQWPGLDANLGFFPPAQELLRGLNFAPGNFGGGIAAGLGIGGNGILTTTFRSGDRFTTRHQEGSLVITVTGKVADAKASVIEIRVQDGGESHKYKGLDKVPERYRDKVKDLVEMSEKGAVKVEIKKP